MRDVAILRAMRPANRRVVLLGAAGLAGLSAVAQLAVLDRSFVPLDEGHLALTAHRILDGDLLYRDIHTGLFPGVYWLTAGLFALFGEDLLVTRIAQAFVNLATVLLLWAIGLRLAPARWALLPCVLLVALGWMAFPVLTMLNYAAVAGLFGLAALLQAIRYAETGRTGAGVAVGVLVGLCLLSKQNYGGLAALALGAGLLAVRGRSALAGRPLVPLFAPVVAGGSALLLLAGVGLAATSSLPDWLDRTLLTLLGSQLASFDNPMPPVLGPHPEGEIRFFYLYMPSALFDRLVRGEPFLGGPLEPTAISSWIRLSYGLPLAILLAASARLAWSAGARARGACSASGLSAPAILAGGYGVVFFFGIFPSAVYSHLVYVLAPILLLAGWLGAGLEAWLEERARGLGRTSWGMAVSLTAALFVASATLPAGVRAAYATPSTLPGATLRLSSTQAALHEQAIRFVEDCAQPGEPIFTLPVLPILYLASGHPNPVRYDLLIPGAIDEDEIIERLETRRVRCIVRQRDMYPEFRPLEALYPKLDGYILENYTRGRPLRSGDQLWHGLVRSAPFGPSEAKHRTP